MVNVVADSLEREKAVSMNLGLTLRRDYIIWVRWGKGAHYAKPESVR